MKQEVKSMIIVCDGCGKHYEDGNGRIYQGETNVLMGTRFVDVTEDVAKAIAKYISPK